MHRHRRLQSWDTTVALHLVLRVLRVHHVCRANLFGGLDRRATLSGCSVHAFLNARYGEIAAWCVSWLCLHSLTWSEDSIKRQQVLAC